MMDVSRTMLIKIIRSQYRAMASRRKQFKQFNSFTNSSLKTLSVAICDLLGNTDKDAN